MGGTSGARYDMVHHDDINSDILHYWCSHLGDGSTGVSPSPYPYIINRIFLFVCLSVCATVSLKLLNGASF